MGVTRTWGFGVLGLQGEAGPQVLGVQGAGFGVSPWWGQGGAAAPAPARPCRWPPGPQWSGSPWSPSPSGRLGDAGRALAGAPLPVPATAPQLQCEPVRALAAPSAPSAPPNSQCVPIAPVLLVHCSCYQCSQCSQLFPVAPVLPLPQQLLIPLLPLLCSQYAPVPPAAPSPSP